MLHARCHWITVSNIGCDPGHINVFDSIPTGYIPARTKEQLASILYSQHPEFVLDFPAVQEQRGSNDCGVFALAFAASLCAGEDPTTISYVQHALREHLLHCLQAQEIQSFPRRSRLRKKAKPLSCTTVKVYCVCRLPESGTMVMCDVCQEWYHTDCVPDVSDSILSNRNTQWFCNNCL